MKKRIAIFSGLIYSDRYFIYSNFPELIKNENIEITVYTNVKSNCEEFNKLHYNHPNLKFSYFKLEDLFYHRLTYFIRRLNDKLHDFSSFGSKTRQYLFKNLHSSPKNVTEKFYNFFLLFNSHVARILIRNISYYIHLFAVKKNNKIVDILSKSDFVILNWSYNLHNQSIAAYCKKMKIQFAYHIQGFDNITTKPRFIFQPNAILTWSKRMNKDITRLYPEYKIPLVAIGNIQFEIMNNPNFFEDKATFFKKINFSNDKFTITFGLGSPNLFKEEYMLLEWLNQVEDTIKDKIQVIVRPHPAFKTNNLKEKFLSYTFSIHYQDPNQDLIESDYQSKESIINWINTIKYSDVLINTSSTLSLDFSFFNKPVININYDASPNKKDDIHIKAVQTIWEHFAAIINHDVLYIANSYNDINTLLIKLIKNIDDKSEKRKKLINDICLSYQCNATIEYIKFLKNL